MFIPMFKIRNNPHSAAIGEPDLPEVSVEITDPLVQLSGTSFEPSPVETSVDKPTSPVVQSSTIVPTTAVAPTTDMVSTTIIPREDTSNIANGPVEGWRNSISSNEDTHDTPEHGRKGKNKGTHAEVASTRKHLKKCTMS